MNKRAGTSVFLGLSWLLAAGIAWGDVPDDAARLLPSDVFSVVVARSIDEADAAVATAYSSFNPNSRERGSARQHLEDQYPELAAIVDYTRPVILAHSPNPVGLMPSTTVIVALRDEGADLSDFKLNPAVAAVATWGSYLGWSTDPGYVTAAHSSKLTEGLPDAPIVLRADLQRILDGMRPFLDAGLQKLEQGAMGPGVAQPDAAGGADMLRQVLDSVHMLELSMDSDGDDHLAVTTTFEVFPASALDLGPQPSNKNALRLAAALPDDADHYGLIAYREQQMYVNLPWLLEAQTSGAMRQLREPVRTKMQAWWTQLFEIWLSLEDGTVYSLDLGADDSRWSVLSHTESAVSIRDHLDQHLLALEDTGVGAAVVSRPTEMIYGYEVRSYDVHWNPLEMMSAIEESLVTWEDTERVEFMTWIDQLVPTIWVAAADHRLLICAAKDSGEIEGVLARLRSRTNDLPAPLGALMKEAGPDANVLGTYEMRALLQAVAAMARGAGIRREQTVPDGPPVPFSMWGRVDATRQTYTVTSDFAQLMAMMRGQHED